MKRLLALLFVACTACLPVTAFGQSGYPGLRYGESVTEARATLEDMGFQMIWDRDVLKKFATDGSTKVLLVDLVVDPESSTLAGWVVYFNESLDDDAQMAILEEIKALHGASFVPTEDENMIAAPLPNGREMSLAFSAEDNLALLVYFDRAREALFDTCASRNAEWRAQADN